MEGVGTSVVVSITDVCPVSVVSYLVENIGSAFVCQTGGIAGPKNPAARILRGPTFEEEDFT